MMKNLNHIKTKQNSGFTLLEVLITLVILAIGLLGLAGLQASGIKNNHSAYHRSQATLAVYDMIDRVRANKLAINNYLTTFMNPTIATAKIGCTTSGCTNTQMAEHDLYEWNLIITSLLPSGAGEISQNGSIYTVKVTWDDDRDGDNTNNPEFEASFQP
jgi:type IV pilus assembly protein PilV